MAKLFLSFTTLLLGLTLRTASVTTTATYIIHTDNHTRPSLFPTQSEWYSSIIQSISISSNSDNTDDHRRIFYNYDTAMHGFAASLTPQEAESASKIPGVLGVYKDELISLHTTRSADFLGLTSMHNSPPNSGSHEEDIIIGVVDTGIWPESPSFDDAGGLPPVPRHWKGRCEHGVRFNSSFCNRKLIGARFFFKGFQAMGLLNLSYEYLSPRDWFGHGTHTASTAAGSPVNSASLFGFANGTARGMAARARVAMYKACWGGGCAFSDVVAAMDSAIHDGVNVLSISLGFGSGPHYDNPVAIGAFAAVRQGIFVACSAGNGGPNASTVINSAPWITSVGAGTIDRKFPARVQLGNGEVLVGESLYTFKANHTDQIPLVQPPSCNMSYLVPDLIMGKIVVCLSAYVGTGMLVQSAGGAGMIGLNPPTQGEGVFAEAFTLPALSVGYSEGLKVTSYMNSTSNPTAKLEFECETIVGQTRAPTVAYFSSRGPDRHIPEILKPDILAPGMNILAAFPTERPPSFNDEDTRRSGFNMMSGTSMSCPHIAGIAGVVLGGRPAWSPAMVRSALMTTAVAIDNSYRPIVRDENLEPATPMDIGAGHVNPPMAGDPGLVYDAGVQDYVDFLCTINYTEKQIRRFVHGPFSCSWLEGGVGDLNYPSFAVVFDNATKVKVLKRTVTKVSKLRESYKVRVVNSRPDIVEILVEPEKLDFGGAGEKRSYRVEFRSKKDDMKEEKMEHYGYVIWESKQHQVKSPVVFMWK